jgi:hypothetical protein
VIVAINAVAAHAEANLDMTISPEGVSAHYLN